MFGADLTGFFASKLYYTAFVGIVSLYAFITVVLTIMVLIRDPFARPLGAAFMSLVGPMLNALFFAFFVIDSWKIQVFTVCVCLWAVRKTYKANAQVKHVILTRNYTHFYEKEDKNYIYKWDSMNILKDDLYKQDRYNSTFNVGLLELFVILISYPIGYMFFIRGTTGNVSDEGMILFTWGACLTFFYVVRPIFMDFVIHMRMISLIKKRLAENPSET